MVTTLEVTLRGAPKRLLKRLYRHVTSGHDREILEILIEGPGGTGKSRGIGHVLYLLLERFPGIRVLVARKTRASLTESFLETWENEVLPPDHPCRAGANRAHRQSYEFPNGSVMVLGGLDNATRLYSTQYDVVYVQEAVELTEDEWERFYRALRHWCEGITFQLLLGDTNPDAPTHWLNQRCIAGTCERMTSRHKDNPSLWNGTEWTFEGLAYIGGLQRMSGLRRRRLLDGEWCSAEGAVWETFDSAVHVIDRPADLRKDLGIRYYVGAIDWGYSDPGVFQVWGVTENKIAYRVAEWYTTNALQEWWVEQVVTAIDEFDPMIAVVCDPSNPGAKDAINARMSRMGRRGIARSADNARHSQGGGDLVGLDLVRERFVDPASIFFLRDSLRCRDELLELNKRPRCTEQEIPGYVYLLDESGRPIRERTDPRCPDHGCDAMRYMASFVWPRDLTPRLAPMKPPLGSYASVMAARNPEAVAEWLEVDNARRIAAEKEDACRKK